MLDSRRRADPRRRRARFATTPTRSTRLSADWDFQEDVSSGRSRSRTEATVTSAFAFGSPLVHRRDA
jgi:hypothetical protein